MGNVANYSLDYLGSSILSIDEKGTIIYSSALPFQKYVGRKLTDLERELETKDRDGKTKAYKGLRFLGYTKNETLVLKGSPDDPDMKKRG
jgi:hypothetical protein